MVWLPFWKLCNKFEKEGATINFYVMGMKKEKSHIYPHFNQIAQELFTRSEVFGIQKLNIIIAPLVPQSNLSNMAPALVLMPEIKKNKNRVYISERVILSLVSTNSEENGKIIQSIDSSKLIKMVMGSLIHEMSHIIQYKKNDSHIFLEKNKIKINECIARMNKEKGVTITKSNSLVVYDRLRRVMIDLLEVLVYEGYAVFNKELYDGRLLLKTKEVTEVYENSQKNASIMDIYFKDSLRKWIKMMEINKKQDVTTLATTMTISIDGEIMGLTYKIKKDGYDVGLHIYQFILYHNPDMELEKLSLLKFNQLIKLYEETCNRAHIKPLISIFSDNGIISYPKYYKFLRDFRKNPEEFIKKF